MPVFFRVMGTSGGWQLTCIRTAEEFPKTHKLVEYIFMLFEKEFKSESLMDSYIFYHQDE
jgi:hypothetical protein